MRVRNVKKKMENCDEKKIRYNERLYMSTNIDKNKSKLYSFFEINDNSWQK